MAGCGRVAVLAALASAGIGCRLGNGSLVESPLPWHEQKAQVMAIAPAGTTREAAIERLAAAGIDGELGSRGTIYYCDLWTRSDGRRWRLDVALLFDEHAQVYDARPANALTEILPPVN